MNSKLYYDDPLHAVIMARDFGVKILVNKYKPTCREVSGLLELARQDYVGKEICKPFYIHPDSYSIFEPKSGDIIYFFPIADETEDYPFVEMFGQSYRGSYYNRGDYRIIQRNNKAFYTPSSSLEELRLTEGE